MDIFEIVLCIGVFGVWVYNYFIGKTVKNLKSMTDATKNIFDSMKTSSDYFNNVHKTVQKLYDPTAVDNVVKLRVELIQMESKKDINKLQKEIEEMQSILNKEKERHLKDKEHTKKTADKAIKLCEKIDKQSRELAKVYKNDVGALAVFVYFASNNLTNEQMNMFLSDENNLYLLKENKMLRAAIGKKVSEKKETI